MVPEGAQSGSGAGLKRSKNSLPWWQANIGLSIVLLFALYLLLLVVAHYAPTPSWLTAARGFEIGKLGPLGDSFGPLTAMFAAVAAFGAWLSYGAQRQQLEDEKNRHRRTRFDEAFFRLLEYYEKEVSELDIRIREFDEPVRAVGVEAISACKRHVKMFLRENDTAESLRAIEWALSKKEFRQVRQLREQIVAITKWLKYDSKDVAVRLRGALLVAKLSNDELWFWYHAIEATNNAGLIAFSNRFGIKRKRAKQVESKPEPAVDTNNAGNR